ncbi:MAG: Wzz/FepE/Etk N-terminal domain-containing protein, partial [Acidimicrobiales bacterium]
MGATTEEGPRTLVVGRRMRGSRWGWVWRRGWVIVVTTVLAAVAALAVSHARTVKYVAEAVLVVQSGASGNGPGSANEAATLAQTYAGLIPQDGAILQVVSSGLGLPALAVQRDITVTIQNGTSILDVHFTDASPSVALAGAAAVAQAVSGPAPATPTIPGGSVVLVHLPTVASQTHSAAGEVVPLGIILGLVLGAVLVVIWERVDGRVDAAADLAGEVDFPTWDADELSPGLASALVVRWRALTGGGPARVVLVVVGSRLDARA